MTERMGRLKRKAAFEARCQAYLDEAGVNLATYPQPGDHARLLAVLPARHPIDAPLHRCPPGCFWCSFGRFVP